MEIHPAANLFPMLETQALRALAEDIRDNGLEVPVVVWRERNVIVDGRNRMAACDLAGVEPAYERRSFSDDADVARFVVSMNIQKRHLDESQRAMIGAKLEAEFFAPAAAVRSDAAREAGGRARHGDVSMVANLPPSTKAREEAAAVVNVSPRTIQHAKTVLDSKSPELKAAVIEGKIAVSAAASIAKRPAEEQAAIVARVTSNGAKNVPQAVRQIEEEKRVAVSVSSPVVSTANLIVGDARENLQVFAGAHCLLTDPPYGIETHRTREGGKDYADGEDYALTLLDEVLAGVVPILTDDAHVYVFSGYSYAHAFKQIIAKHLEIQDNPIVWVKGNHTMCDFAQWYPSKHEYVWFARKRGTRRRLTACVPDVIECKSQRDTTHSAEKPIDLLSKLIEQSTVRGELVADPFSGSGATGAAAIATGRRFVGTEIDSKWAAVARSRLTNAA